MKTYFQWMAGSSGRFLRLVFGLAILTWGYLTGQYPLNIVLIIVGSVAVIFTLLNISFFAIFFGYPADGKMLRSRDVRAQRHKEREPAKPETGAQQRVTYHTGSTVQGGSNYGQGSMQLGVNANKQGSEQNRGANYANEADRLGDTPEGDK